MGDKLDFTLRNLNFVCKVWGLSVVPKRYPDKTVELKIKDPFEIPGCELSWDDAEVYP